MPLEAHRSAPASGRSLYGSAVAGNTCAPPLPLPTHLPGFFPHCHSCSVEISRLLGQLNTVRADLATTRGDLATARSDLTTARSDLTSTKAALRSANAAKATCQADFKAEVRVGGGVGGGWWGWGVWRGGESSPERSGEGGWSVRPTALLPSASACHRRCRCPP